MAELLEYLARQLVDEPDAVRVEHEQDVVRLRLVADARQLVHQRLVDV